MAATRAQTDINSPLSYRVTDSFGNVTVMQVVGQSGDLQPKPQGFTGGLLTLGIVGNSLPAYLTVQNVSDLLPALQHFVTYGNIV